MNYKISLLLSAVLLTLLLGCNFSSERRSPDAHFKGHIVNPRGETVILSKDSTVMDTSFLDRGQNFSFHLKNVEEGLYNFQHGHEWQVIYLTPGDSLLAWVNTIQFDETLHYSGEGAEENNFLINLFLQNEKNTDLVLDYYKIKPATFAAITDSIEQNHINKLEELFEKKDISEDFVEVAKKMIQFEQNNQREQYAYLVNKYYPEFSDEFPEDFFDYRESVNLNEIAFQSNPAYLGFIENYLINLSMQNCEGEPGNNPCYDQNDITNIIKRIKLADSLTSLPLVKQYFFNLLGSTGMVMGKNREELVSVLEVLQEKGISENDYTNLLTLGSIQLAFIPGINIGDTPIVTTSGEHTTIEDFIDRRSILYLWSINSPRHHKVQHQKIEELEEKYPELDFVGFNIDIGETSAWQNALRKYNYDMDQEFQLDTIQIREQPVGSEVLKSYLNKLLFLDRTGTVVIGDAYLNSPDFESRVLEFLNL